jgi:hypothetical protein
MSEQQLVAAIIEAVNDTGLAHVWRCHAGRVRVRGGWIRLAPNGTPDIVGYSILHAGVFVGIEVKIPIGKNKRLAHPEHCALQAEWRARACARGAIVFMATGVQQALDALRTWPSSRESAPGNITRPGAGEGEQRETAAAGVRLAGGST